MWVAEKLDWKGLSITVWGLGILTVPVVVAGIDCKMLLGQVWTDKHNVTVMVQLFVPCWIFSL
jgi:hypothetical protein